MQKRKRLAVVNLGSKFETLRREIKADVKKQHDLYVNNLVGDIKANPRDFYRYINGQKKDTQGIPPLKGINSDYWKALVLSLITAGGVIKFEEVWQAHSSGLFQVRSLRGGGGLALCHIAGTCIVNHQIPLIGIIPLRGIFITSWRDLIIPSLWQPFDLSSIGTRQGP